MTLDYTPWFIIGLILSISSIGRLKGEIVKIDCYISQGCGSEGALKENVYRALEAEGIQAEVGVHRISDEKAAELKLSGSPSVFINGKELQPSGTTGFS